MHRHCQASRRSACEKGDKIFPFEHPSFDSSFLFFVHNRLKTESVQGLSPEGGEAFSHCFLGFRRLPELGIVELHLTLVDPRVRPVEPDMHRGVRHVGEPGGRGRVRIRVSAMEFHLSGSRSWVWGRRKGKGFEFRLWSFIFRVEGYGLLG